MAKTNSGRNGFSRRTVLAGIGGLSFSLALGADGVRLTSAAQSETSEARRMSAWVRIAPDDTIHIYSAGAEMGQGSLTSLAVIVAEEMDADWSKVVVEFAPSEAEPYGYAVGNGRSMAIVGSNAVRRYYTDLRMAGAQVRKILVANAAEHWGVDATSLTTEPGVVIEPASGRRLSYGAIAVMSKAPASPPSVAANELKAPAKFRLIGHSLPRVDVPAKVDGSAQFAIDVRLPGMVYATTVHSPVQEGVPESWNDAEIKAMQGVIGTVALPNGVAIVADRWERVIAARSALRVNWQKQRARGFDSESVLSEGYAKVHHDPNAPRKTEDDKGDVAAAFASAAKTHRVEFRSDFGYHAQMEPLNAVARFNTAGDAVEVWDGSQAPDRARIDIAGALGMKVEQVTLHQCYMGGGFGRRSLADYSVEAALVARKVGAPVKLIWTREEDVAHGMFRPQAFQCLEAAEDSEGRVVGWRHCIIGDGGSLITGGANIGPYYEIPNTQIEHRGVSHGARLKHWRAVAHPFNMFAIESLVDEIAATRSADPVAFRLQRMGATPRAKAVIEAAAEMANWTAPRPEGRALGIAMSERSGSLGAGIVEISLDRESGRIRVHKVWMAVDGGTVVQPEAARANIESGIVWGLSGALYERVTMRDGIVEQSNFHNYTVLKMSDMPEEMHVRFIDSALPPTGLGEIGNPFAAAALSNAVFKLTGKRLRHMPFTPERVRAVLQA
jgi:isoquinoline 1-oxidoreductase beta subunit